MANRTTKIIPGGVAAGAAALISGDAQISVTAAGTTQATATAAYGDNIHVSTTPASSGIVLSGSAFGPGDDVFVTNQGANALLIYPPTGGQINALGANAGYSLAAGKSCLLHCFGVINGNTQFYTLLSA